MFKYDFDERVRWLGAGQRLAVLLHEAGCDLETFYNASSDQQFIEAVMQKAHSVAPTIELSVQNLEWLVADSLCHLAYSTVIGDRIAPYILSGQAVKDLPVTQQKIVACRYGNRDKPLGWRGVATILKFPLNTISDEQRTLFYNIYVGANEYYVGLQEQRASEAGDLELIANIPDWQNNQRLVRTFTRELSIVYVNELRTFSESELSELNNIGPKSVLLVKAMLDKRGYELRQE
jgi:hypothetical protein